MKRTVILSPYKREFSGTAELIGNSLRVTVNHPNNLPGTRLKLYALSTSRAATYPCMVGIYEIQGISTDISETISSDALSAAGYRIEDIDTYLITTESGSSEEAAAAAFFGLEWNAARFLTRPLGPLKPKEEPIDSDNTLSNAENILSSLKGGKKVSLEKIDKYINDFKKNIQQFEKCDDVNSSIFEWYKITSPSPVSSLSAVRHILSGKFAASGISSAGYYIAGIKKTDNRHIAIGIPGCRHICPMPQLTDCCSFEGGYHIAGIYLAEDGQYFEKYLQNDK